MSIPPRDTPDFGVDSSIPQGCMSHDDVWALLREKCPGLLQYLNERSGSLEEVWVLVNTLRSLFNENAVKTSHLMAQSDRLISNHRELQELRDLTRRMALMVDKEQYDDPDTQMQDLVSCALPKALAKDLLIAARPYLVKHGEQQLKQGAAVFNEVDVRVAEVEEAIRGTRRQP